MKELSYLEYQGLNNGQRFVYKLKKFFCAFGGFFARIGKAIATIVKTIVLGIVFGTKNLVMDFVKGSWRTKLSYVIMGFGNMTCGQIVRGLFYLAFEVVFFGYTATTGVKWLSKLDNLGDAAAVEVYDPILDAYTTVHYDDSFQILLYGGLSLLFIFLFLFVWRMNIRGSRVNDQLKVAGKHIPKFREDVHELVDGSFHKTLLTIPVIGITCFTILPMLFMIVVAFTSYDGAHDGYSNLFTWVGWQNFAELFNSTESNLGYAFKHILGWTLVWAFFATFSNYFLGIVVALLINKKGIKFKKLWRSIFVLTIAIPQFISLLYVSKLFDKSGLVNSLLMNLGILASPYDFWGNTASARILVILVNIWVGIPYLMLMCTGILMNIPDDLYESARIDGANAVQQFFKITLPYMLFVTGPYLLTSFIGNINNFNVIYLLAGGAKANPALTTSGGSASNVDLLITWLFKITTGTESNYKLASVVGIMIFVVVATLSVIVYNILPSNKNEEDFQ